MLGIVHSRLVSFPEVSCHINSKAQHPQQGIGVRISALCRVNPRVVDFMDEDLFADEEFIEELLAATRRGCEFDICGTGPKARS